MLDKINEIKTKLKALSDQKIRLEAEQNLLQTEKQAIIAELTELRLTPDMLNQQIISLREELEKAIIKETGVETGPIVAN